MAIITSFLEVNETLTIEGITIPIWLKGCQLGKQSTFDITTGWQLSDPELAMVNYNEGVVFVQFYGAQPLMNVLGANALQFEGQNAPYSHPHAFTLATDERLIIRNGVETKAITSAWQLAPEQLAETNRNGGVVFLRTVGCLPPVLVSGFDLIQVSS